MGGVRETTVVLLSSQHQMNIFFHGNHYIEMLNVQFHCRDETYRLINLD